MAKSSAAKKEETMALATTEPAGALAEVLDGVDLGTDGLEEIDGRDIQIAALVFNMKGVDQNDDPIPPNVFYNTVTEKTTKRVHLVLLTLHKTREWREFDNGKNESVVHCRSMDNVTGELTATGAKRACKGCPDYEWQSIDGKRTRKCGDVWNLAAVDKDTNEPVVIRCKKTSLAPIKTYLNRHFIGRLTGKDGKRGNVPLFAMSTHASLKMSEDGKYALPVFEPGDILPRAEILAHQESAKTYREIILPALSKLAEKDVDDGGSRASGDTSFNPNDFAEDSAASNAPNMFG